MPLITVDRIRRSDHVARLRRIKIRIDDDVAFSLGPGESCSAQVSPGHHVIVANLDWVRSPPVTFDVDDEDRQYTVSMPNVIMHWYEIFQPWKTYKQMAIVLRER